MLEVALLYRTREGQTVKILEVIANHLHQRGCRTTLFDVSDQTVRIDWDRFDAFVLGCSIRYGHHHKDFCQFVEKYSDQLNRKPSFFYSVNLTARKPQRSQPDNNRYLQKYLHKTSWKPDLVEVFAGALLYSQYDFFNKRAIQLIMKLTGGSTDTSKDIEFTDWNRVAGFAGAVAAHLEELEMKPGQRTAEPA